MVTVPFSFIFRIALVLTIAAVVMLVLANVLLLTFPLSAVFGGRPCGDRRVRWRAGARAGHLVPCSWSPTCSRPLSASSRHYCVGAGVALVLKEAIAVGQDGG